MPLVLVVDDDRVINTLISDLLADEGIAVRSATNGAEALQALDSCVPDLIILDLRMPVMDGYTFYHELRADERPEVSGISVMIASAQGATRAQRELGAEAAVAKPFDLERLLAMVNRLLGLPVAVR